MINKINSISNYITASYSADSPYILAGAPSAGLVRYNSGIGSLEVYDGSIWKLLGGSAIIQLTPESELALQWAINKMNDEAKLNLLCKQYPGLEKAKNNYELFRRMVESGNLN